MAIVKQSPQIEEIARYGGAIFLAIYAVLSIKSALTSTHALDVTIESNGSLFKAVVICPAFTWLNLHVYLDTVILLGSVSTQYQPNQVIFAIGAMTASFIFFFSLGYGSRFLAALFKRPIAWKVLELIVGLAMISITISLIYGT